MWLKTRVGKRIQIRRTQTELMWEGPLVDVDALGLTINDADAGPTFVPFHSVFAVHVFES